MYHITVECEILCCAGVSYQYNTVWHWKESICTLTHVAHLYPLHACGSKLTAVYKC